MKNRTLILALPILLVFFLAACAPQVATTQPAVDVTAAPAEIATQPPTAATESSAPAATTAPADPAVDVMALIQEKLQGHHDLDRILNAKHTREEWNSTLDRMIKYGANISEDEKKIIIDYLLSRQ
jgi:hypothetical protein